MKTIISITDKKYSNMQNRYLSQFDAKIQAT